MKTSQAALSPSLSAYPQEKRTWHTPRLLESALRLRSKVAGGLAGLFLAGLGSATATDFIRNGDFEGSGGTPDPGYVTGFAPYSPANLYWPWSAFGGTGTGGGFEQPNGVGRIANPFPGAANNSPTVWEDFGNPTYVNTASQNYMSDVWLIPGATYHIHAQFYIPSSEVTAGTQPRAGMYLSLFSGGTIRILNPRYPDDPANQASATIPVTDAWHTYDFNWVCPSVDAGGNPLIGPTQMNYASYRWYGGDPTLTPDGTNNYGLSQGTHTNPGGYLDNVQISSAAYTGGLSGLVKNSTGPLQDVMVAVSYSGSRFRTDPANPITPSNGTYSVAGLIPGQVYSITASKVGYSSKTVTATAGATVPDIVLDPVAVATRYEAENAVLSGCTIQADGNASNGARVAANVFGGNDTVTFTFNAPAAGLYPMTIGYYQPWDANRDTYLTVNGAALGTIASPQTSGTSYGVTAPRNVALNAGSNTLVLSNGIAWGPHWDYIELQGAVPSATVSGTVTDSGSPIAGASIKATETANPAMFSASAPSAADGSYSVIVAVGNEVQLSASSLPAGKQVATAPAAFTPANTSPISGKNITLSNIPGYDPDMLFAMKIESLSSLNPGDATGNRPTASPVGGSMVSLNSPTVVDVNGVKWEENVYADGDGYRFVAPDVPGGVYTAPIPTNGVSVVAVVQPKYIGVAGEARGEIVDFFYSELYLAVSHNPANEGEVIVNRRGYLSENTGYKIPDGQKTILSLVVQPNGDMTLYVNGLQRWSKSTGVDYTSLQQTGLSGGAKTITVGRNDYDGWSIFSGNIGDVYVYKKALDNTALTTLQNDLATKFAITFPQTFTITTTGTNGTISPAGPYQAEQGTNQTFNFIATAGYVNVVTVDGQIQAGHPTSYTFNNVQASHSLNVTFTVEPPPVNDNFAGAINLPGDSGTQSGTANFAATFETGEPAINGETNTVWFKWTAAANGNFTVSTDGSTTPANTEWDAILAIYKGTSVNALTVVQPPKDTVLSETVTVSVTAGTTYYIQLAGYTGADRGVAANLMVGWSFVVPPPPNPYGDWSVYYFTAGSPESAMGADPDNDGMNNLQEYAFDEDPTSGANATHMRTTIEDVGGEKALLLTVAVIDSAVFSGSPSLTATAGGVVYTIQGGNGLSGFNQAVTEVTPARSTNMPVPYAGWVYRTFRLSGPISAHPAGFLRIRTEPAP